MIGYTNPDAIAHAAAASRAAANAIHARHCGSAFWWMSIARQQAVSAEIAEMGLRNIDQGLGVHDEENAR